METRKAELPAGRSRSTGRSCGGELDPSPELGARGGLRFVVLRHPLARFYRRHGFTIHAPGEPLILPDFFRHPNVGASPLPGEQMFSRTI